MKATFSLCLSLTLIVLLLPACRGGELVVNSNRLPLLATTSIVADVVRQVGGEYVQVVTLLPPGTDPHTYQPRPQDAAAIAQARLVFANGAGLEEFLQPLLENSGATEKLVAVSEGIELLPPSDEEENHYEEGHHHEAGDPHTWMDPNNVLVWVDNIVTALSSADPSHASAYQANAEAYAAKLRALDAWIRQQVERVPPEDRLLVADHAVFGCFARQYGFRQVGTITASFSTDAAPSARELAALEDTIRALGVKAIFVGTTVNPQLAERIATDTGVRLVRIYTGSLTTGGGEADTYLDFMRYNVNAIVTALTVP